MKKDDKQEQSVWAGTPERISTALHTKTSADLFSSMARLLIYKSSVDISTYANLGVQIIQHTSSSKALTADQKTSLASRWSQLFEQMNIETLLNNAKRTAEESPWRPYSTPQDLKTMATLLERMLRQAAQVTDDIKLYVPRGLLGERDAFNGGDLEKKLIEQLPDIEGGGLGVTLSRRRHSVSDCPRFHR